MKVPVESVFQDKVFSNFDFDLQLVKKDLTLMGTIFLSGASFGRLIAETLLFGGFICKISRLGLSHFFSMNLSVSKSI